MERCIYLIKIINTHKIRSKKVSQTMFWGPVQQIRSSLSSLSLPCFTYSQPGNWWRGCPSILSGEARWQAGFGHELSTSHSYIYFTNFSKCKLIHRFSYWFMEFGNAFDSLPYQSYLVSLWSLWRWYGSLLMIMWLLRSDAPKEFQIYRGARREWGASCPPFLTLFGYIFI